MKDFAVHSCRYSVLCGALRVSCFICSLEFAYEKRKGRDKSLCNFVTRFEVESGLLSLTVWPEDGLVVATTKFVALFVLGRGLY